MIKHTDHEPVLPPRPDIWFEAGERVLFESSALGVESASLSVEGMYARLNHVPLITARVLSCEAMGSGAAWVHIRPDGWPLPEAMWPHGFFTVGSRLKRYDGDETHPVQVEDERGRVLGDDQVRRMVRELVRKEASWRFDRPQWEVMQEMGLG